MFKFRPSKFIKILTSLALPGASVFAQAKSIKIFLNNEDGVITAHALSRLTDSQINIEMQRSIQFYLQQIKEPPTPDDNIYNDEFSYNAGLLYDLKKKFKLETPTKEDDSIIFDNLGGDLIHIDISRVAFGPNKEW